MNEKDIIIFGDAFLYRNETELRKLQPRGVNLGSWPSVKFEENDSPILYFLPSDIKSKKKISEHDRLILRKKLNKINDVDDFINSNLFTKEYTLCKYDK